MVCKITKKKLWKTDETHPAQGLKPSPKFSRNLESKARNLHCVFHCVPPHPPQGVPHGVLHAPHQPYLIHALVHHVHHQLKMPSAILAMATVALKSGLSAAA